MPKPSPTSATPIRIRKASASILIVGWGSTKSPIGRAANIITPTAMTIASTMTATSFAMPTAVITESSENTMSMMAICTSVATNPACPPPAAPVLVRRLRAHRGSPSPT